MPKMQTVQCGCHGRAARLDAAEQLAHGMMHHNPGIMHGLEIKVFSLIAQHIELSALLHALQVLGAVGKLY